MTRIQSTPIPLPTQFPVFMHWFEFYPPEIKTIDMLIHAHMAYKAGLTHRNENSCEISATYFATNLRCSKITATSSINRLREHGLITRTETGRNGVGSTYIVKPLLGILNDGRIAAGLQPLTSIPENTHLHHNRTPMYENPTLENQTLQTNPVAESENPASIPTENLAANLLDFLDSDPEDDARFHEQAVARSQQTIARLQRHEQRNSDPY